MKCIFDIRPVRDIGGDIKKNMVSGDKYFLSRLVKAHMTGGMTRCADTLEIIISNPDDFIFIQGKIKPILPVL